MASSQRDGLRQGAHERGILSLHFWNASSRSSRLSASPRGGMRNGICDDNFVFEIKLRDNFYYRFQFKPMFQDFDQPQTGLVSVNQFHRVLHTLGLADLVTTSELEAIIKRFGVSSIKLFEFLDNCLSNYVILFYDEGCSWTEG